MKKRRWLFLALMFAMTAAGCWRWAGPAPQEESAPGPAVSAAPAQNAAVQGEKLQAGCALMQTMRFTRCGHSVSRRIDAPEALTGADFAQTQARYDLWNLDSFSPELVEMSREIPLFCPMHYVAAVNEAGEIVLSQNQYGDGMAILRVYSMAYDELPEETRAELSLGIGFDSQAKAEEWLARQEDKKNR